MFVGPGRTSAGGADDLEDRVGLDELVRVDGAALAIYEAHRQLRGVDLGEGLA